MTPVVASLQRHPLKSHGREALSHVSLTVGAGLPWDRRWAVAHEATKVADGAWGQCTNFSIGSKAPRLMAIGARLDEETATLTLTHPERPDISFRPDDPQDVGRFIDWVLPISPSDRAQPVRIHAAADRGLTDTEYPSVSIISLASNRALGEYMGLDLSALRWRANIWLEGLRPWEERSWIGRHVRIGSAVLRITEPKERCRATTANPATGMRDADTLRALQAMHGNQDFGIYAEVVEGGTIEVGEAAGLLA